MKRFIAVTMATIMLAGNAFAADISVTLDGENVEFSTQSPVIVEGRTLVPLRGVFEKLGYGIGWDNETKTATFVKDMTVVKVTANASEFTVGTDVFKLDVPAQIINGSMMLPLRAIGEATGLFVDWNNDTKTVALNSEEEIEENDKTEEKLIDGIPQSNLENVQGIVKGFTSIISVIELKNVYSYIEDYCLDEVIYAVDYAGEEEIEATINESIEFSETFKKIVAELNVHKSNQNLVKKFDDVIDSSISAYKFLKNLHLTDMYDDLTDEQYDAKTAEVLNLMMSSELDYYEALAKNVSELSNNESVKKYSSFNRSERTEEASAEAEKYYEEVGKVIDKSTKALIGIDITSPNSQKPVKCAEEIREKLNSTDTSEICVMDREFLLSACDLLEEASEKMKSVSNSDDFSVDMIIAENCLINADEIFKAILEDNYDFKLIEEDDIEDLEKIEEAFL